MEQVDTGIAVDLGIAVMLTLGITDFAKRILTDLTGRAVSKFAPLISVVAAGVAVSLVADLDAITLQEFALATVVVAGHAVGAFSFVKNVSQGVRRKKREGTA